MAVSDCFDTPDGTVTAQGPPDDMGGNSFPPELRLRRPIEFQRVLAKGWRWTTMHLVVHVFASGGEKSRLGLTVSRKVGDAVTRNRVKRRLRDSFRTHVRQAIGNPCVDLVLRALPGAADASQGTLQAEVLAALDAWHLGKSQRARQRSRRPEG
jgi:ribonuclease P protein component